MGGQKQKPYVIEWWTSLWGWGLWKRYLTKERMKQAFSVLERRQSPEIRFRMIFPEKKEEENE